MQIYTNFGRALLSPIVHRGQERERGQDKDFDDSGRPSKEFVEFRN